MTEATGRPGVAAAIGVLVALEGAVFLLAAVVHGGVRVPIGITEPVILPAMIVEGLVGLSFVVAAYTVFARKSRAWTAVVTAHGIAAAGILLGMAALALGRGPRTEANELYHRVTLAVSLAVLVFMLMPFTRVVFGRGDPG